MKHRQPHDPNVQPRSGVPAEKAMLPDSGPRGKRPWLPSTGGALLMVALLIAISVLVNPLLGRYIHWQRIDFGAPVVFLGLTLALRRRWV